MNKLLILMPLLLCSALAAVIPRSETEYAGATNPWPRAAGVFTAESENGVLFLMDDTRRAAGRRVRITIDGTPHTFQFQPSLSLALPVGTRVCLEPLDGPHLQLAFTVAPGTTDLNFGKSTLALQHASVSLPFRLTCS
ncbi:hypothetical protein DVJ83_18050 (plasmid) [Deinococcus wulumuqiensis]|uniref:Uncharacterized protein n=1 Tax=Deinococcus wulumuqiensis TaxID=980427 RepID=A0A345IMS8_9DEIO|nr:hypothetical protein [Deinococcus wulumuqiensis]AXH01001.1 hypothetical protein DVJ83_18050 [Deinococcus wulumuqiensis]